VKIGLAQINTRVGAIDANTSKVLDYAARARASGCDLVLFPELTICGYPPEDLLLHRGLRSRVQAALAEVRDRVRGIAVYVGYPEYHGDAVYNSAALLRDGALLANHRKVELPNYAVFDEKRYFQPGDSATVVELDDLKLGLVICEDAWVPQPCRATAAAGAEGILVINGSPFNRTQQQTREHVLAQRAHETSLPLVYVNMVGGQDELVFDGGAVAVDARGEVDGPGGRTDGVRGRERGRQDGREPGRRVRQLAAGRRRRRRRRVRQRHRGPGRRGRLERRRSEHRQPQRVRRRDLPGRGEGAPGHLRGVRPVGLHVHPDRRRRGRLLRRLRPGLRHDRWRAGE
jgi:NAD+ synthase (glutamine-hydrolysing)